MEYESQGSLHQLFGFEFHPHPPLPNSVAVVQLTTAILVKPEIYKIPRIPLHILLKGSKNMKKLLDLLLKRRLQENLEQIKLQAFNRWLRRDLIGDTPGQADGHYKPENRYVEGPD